MKGLEVGEANKAPFDKIGLAMQRIGNSYLQLGKLEESIVWLKKALLNDRYSCTHYNIFCFLYLLTFTEMPRVFNC